MSNIKANFINSENITVTNLNVTNINGVSIHENCCNSIGLGCQNEDCECSFYANGNYIATSTGNTNINLSAITTDIVPVSDRLLNIGTSEQAINDVYIGGAIYPSANEPSGNIYLGGNLIPVSGKNISIGSFGNPIDGIYVASNTIYVGNATISSNNEGGIELPSKTRMNNVELGTINIKDTVDNSSNLPLPIDSSNGDGIVTSNDGNLWVYTEYGWKNIGEIRGPKGERGNTGEQGPIGAQGIQGPIGNTGPIGLQGMIGNTGPQGNTGPIGPTGEQGIQGPIGNKGNTGSIGPTGPQGIIGPIGPQGPIGTQGIIGPTGPQGIIGNTGPQGPTGLQGPQGIIGSIGPQGIIGNTGPQGPQGVIGPQGIIGNTGPQGIIGNTGPQGPTGLQGPQGVIGPIGPQGIIGNTGPQGPTGLQGPQGVIGNTGPTGPIGLTGPTGLQGPIGLQGVIGPTGPQGIIGNTGPQGPTGLQGPTGEQGSSNYNCTTIGFFTDVGNAFDKSTIYSLPHPIILNIKSSLESDSDTHVGWPILPSSIGLYFNVFGNTINGVPTSKIGSTYGAMFPGNYLGLSCEILAVSVNYQNNEDTDIPYSLYIANYGNGIDGTNLQVKKIADLINNTFGSVENSFEKVEVSYRNESEENSRIKINHQDYYGLFITRSTLKSEYYSVESNKQQSEEIIESNDLQIIIESPKILIDATVYLLQQ